MSTEGPAKKKSIQEVPDEKGKRRKKTEGRADEGDDGQENRPYEIRTRSELCEIAIARTAGVEGSSGMDKDELIDALRGQ